MKSVTEIMDAAIMQEKVERQQAKTEVKDENLEVIVEYFGNDAGLEKVVKSFGVDYNALSVDARNGLLCILHDANKQWETAPCDEDGPTPDQDKNLDDILMTTACDLIRYFKRENIN
jgi:hypothetical protein